MENKIIQFPESVKPKMTFINENGKWILKSVKKSAQITHDVVRVYSKLLLSALELAIKIGLFVFLLPHFMEFINALMLVLMK